MSRLSVAELRKRVGRIETFLDKLMKNDPFETVNGTYHATHLIQIRNKKVVRVYDVSKPKDFDDAAKALDTMNDLFKISSASDIKFTQSVPLSQLINTGEFGAKKVGSGGELGAEDRAIRLLRIAIDQAVKKNKGPISIKTKNGPVHDIVDVVKTQGIPKSDFHLVNTDGEPVFWISHKDGYRADHFQQWGGVSKRSDLRIHEHAETRRFIKDIKKAWPKGLPPATSIYRNIKDRKLKMLAVYGNSFGSSYGENNVTVTIQGDPGLKSRSGLFYLTANHVYYNGDIIKEGYVPVLMAIYKGDRSDANIPGTRIVIAPQSGRKASEF